MKNIQSSIVIGLMCFMLTIGIAVQIKSIESETTVIAKKNTENELRDQVLKLNDTYNKTYAKLEKSEKKLSDIRDKISNYSDQTSNWSKELEKINHCLGFSNLYGDGVVITFEDLDVSVLRILNDLNNAGVDAIAINGNRIVFNSKISVEGDFFNIDDKTLTAPYEIVAIGGKSLYNALIMPGSYIDLMNNDKNDKNTIKIEAKEDLKIERYTGVYSYKYIKNAN